MELPGVWMIQTLLSLVQFIGIAIMIGVAPQVQRDINQQDINMGVSKMVKEVNQTLSKLSEIHSKLSGIQKAYEILLEQKFVGELHKSYDAKIEIFQQIVKKQEETIHVLKSDKGAGTRNRLMARLEQLQNKFKEVQVKDPLLEALVRLQFQVEGLEKRRKDLEKKLSKSKKGSTYNFAKDD